MAALYFSEDAQATMDSLMDTFQRAGISLVNPESNQVVALDEEGEQVPISESGLRELLRERGEVRFQWWLAKNHDIYCRIRRMNGVVAVELGLDGLTAQERTLVGEVVIEHCKHRAHWCLGLVFDPDGATESYDWDVFFIRGQSLDWRESGAAFPAALAIPERNLLRARNVPGQVLTIVENGLAVMRMENRR